MERSKDTRCLGRLTKWKEKMAFGDGKHYFTLEHRCSGEVVQDGLCDYCLERPHSGKYQDRILHGRITEPIPDVSYIYGGSRYIEYKERYGEPSDEDKEAAEEAHRIACKGYPEVEMAKEGRKREKKGIKTVPPPSTSPWIAANAIEISERPIPIEVERVKVWKCVKEGRVIMVDEQKRIWELNEKGVILGYGGVWEGDLRSNT